MKHSKKIIFILLAMFIIAQLIGIFVAYMYSTNTVPYGLAPPENTQPVYNAFSIITAILIGAAIMIFLIKFKAQTFLRVWFFIVVTIALALTINAVLLLLNTSFNPYYSIIAGVIAIALSYGKVFIRDIRLHNLTELLIYPGIASIFIPLLNIPATISLLILISIYDIYAVWHAGFMQKMAKYQIEQVKVFTGFFIPVISKKDRELIGSRKISKSSKKKIKVSVAILGGGDVVFPIILAGVVMIQFGILSALLISLGATIALAFLFYYGQKGKFYPAMPFISAGCFVGLGLAYLVQLF